MTNPTQAEPSIIPLVRAAFKVAAQPQVRFALVVQAGRHWYVAAIAITEDRLLRARYAGDDERIVPCGVDTKIGDVMEGVGS